MKINFAEEEEKGGTVLGELLLLCACTFSSENPMPIPEDGNNELEIKCNGVDVDVKKFAIELEKVLDVCVKKEAIELSNKPIVELMDKYGYLSEIFVDIANTLDDIYIPRINLDIDKERISKKLKKLINK